MVELDDEPSRQTHDPSTKRSRSVIRRRGGVEEETHEMVAALSVYGR
jgi:hypothetical protein